MTYLRGTSSTGATFSFTTDILVEVGVAQNQWWM